jgi:hypothetical protein
MAKTAYGTRPKPAGLSSFSQQTFSESSKRKKKRMFEVARAKCDKVWLVIVNDMSRTEPVELSDSVARAVGTDPFDRVLWFEPHRQKAWVLGTAEVFCVGKSGIIDRPPSSQG